MRYRNQKAAHIAGKGSVPKVGVGYKNTRVILGTKTHIRGPTQIPLPTSANFEMCDQLITPTKNRGLPSFKNAS